MKNRNNFKNPDVLSVIPFRLFVAYAPGNIFYYHCKAKNNKNTQIYNAFINCNSDKALQKLINLFEQRKQYISSAAIYKPEMKNPYLILKGNFNERI